MLFAVLLYFVLFFERESKFVTIYMCVFAFEIQVCLHAPTTTADLFRKQRERERLKQKDKNNISKTYLKKKNEVEEVKENETKNSTKKKKQEANSNYK